MRKVSRCRFTQKSDRRPERAAMSACGMDGACRSHSVAALANFQAPCASSYRPALSQPCYLSCP